MTQGQVVECRFWTPGLKTGERYVVTEEGRDMGQPVLRVQPLGGVVDASMDWGRARYWAWRFQPFLRREV